jgi:signal transduction histidine kinase
VIRDEGVVAHCAADKVERVMTNLVTNALRYTPAGGKIALSLTKGADAVFVSVEDTGSGIASDSMERVFEPFFRADVARSPADGSAGLGLAIARGLIDAQGGRIWAEAPTAGGARICFMLPAHDREDRTSPHHETNAGSHREDSSSPVSRGRDRRALER